MKRLSLLFLLCLAVGFLGGCLPDNVDHYTLSYQILDDEGDNDTWLSVTFPMISTVQNVAQVDDRAVSGCEEVVDFLEADGLVRFKVDATQAVVEPEAEAVDCFCDQQDTKGTCIFHYLAEILSNMLAQFDRMQLYGGAHRFTFENAHTTLPLSVDSPWLLIENIKPENESSMDLVVGLRLAAQAVQDGENQKENGFNPFPDLVDEEGAKNGGVDSKKGGGFCQLHPGAKWGVFPKNALIPVIFFIGMLLVWRVSKTDSQNS